MEILNPYPHELLPPSRREILRYLRCKATNDETEELIDRAVMMASSAISPALCYTELDLAREDDHLALGPITTNSRDLLHYLKHCDRVVIFAATLGVIFERLVQRESRRSPSTALVLDAVGDERIEALCDDFCRNLAIRYAANGYRCLPRFSAGYGDAPLSLQQDIFKLLSCQTSIGLFLTDSLLMSPQKSVTAFVGISKKETEVKL